MNRYEIGYLWVESTPSNKKLIGLSSHCLEHIGEINWVGLPTVGEVFDKNSTLFVLESSKAAIEVESPLKGTVVGTRECTEEFLSSLKQNPDQVWLIEME
jgi:glycine cleavage system H protein